jgi:hypothetical protein
MTLIKLLRCIKNWLLRNHQDVDDTPQTDISKLEFPAKFPYYIEVLADLPYYVPLPENVILSPSEIGVEPFFVELKVVIPKRHPDESHVENMDDRLGTYLRSRARVLFPKTEPPDDPNWEDIEKKAKSIVNRLIESVRYLVFDHTIRRIVTFDKTIIRSWKLNDDGTVEPAGLWEEGQRFGPFGITPRAQLAEDKVQTLLWLFNGLAPTNPAWHLVLDAKLHNQTGDISRAILDLATALEINIPRLIELFSFVQPRLQRLDLEGVKIWALYDDILMEATGHSLHEEPHLFAALEYIRAIRNSIAHDWKPVFKISPQMEKISKYLDVHKPRDGHRIETQEEVETLVKDTVAIITHTINLFENEY